MAHIKQNVLGIVKGKVGSLSAYTNQTGNVARIRTNATNVGESASRTKKQQSNRVRWANLVDFYKASKAWMPKGFETKKKNRSDYNQFMSINYALSKVALEKSEAAAGACIVEGFIISQGSLAPVQVAKHDDHWDTNLKVGTLAITADTTVAEVAAALIASNNFIHEGMQLSFVSYQQTVDDLGLPRVICTPYEMILDTKNTEEKAYSYLPDFCLAVSEGFLATGDDISVGGFAYVLSETVSGRTMVSTQTLILNNETLIAEYTGAEKIEVAIKSYGLTKNVFLDSDHADSKGATPQPLYIEKIIGVAGSYDGSYHPSLGEWFDDDASKDAQVVMSADVVPSSVSNVSILGDFPDRECVIKAVEGNVITIALPSGSAEFTGHAVNLVRVDIDGTTYEKPF